MASTEKDPGTIAFAKTLSNVPWCDDYEKMISGVLYDISTPFLLLRSVPDMTRYDAQAQELVDGRFRARRLMHKYNTHFPDDATSDSLIADRTAMLQSTFGKVGKGAFIEPPINIDYGCNITIGENFYSNFKYVAPLLCLPI